MPSPDSPPTIGAAAIRILRRHPDRVAFRGPGAVVSYAAALDLVGRFQRAFDERGLRRGQRIALLTGNRAETWCAAIAAQASGMAISWLHPLAGFADHLAQVADLDAAAVLVDNDRHAPRGAELAAALDGIDVLGIGSAEFGPDFLAAALDAGAAAPVDFAGTEDIAAVNYTGGTTGRSKGAVRRHRAALAMNLVATLADFELPAVPQFLNVAPMSHVAGTKFLPVLCRGGTIHLDNGFDPGRLLATIADQRISMTLLVPTMIFALLDDPTLDRTDLSSLQLLLYGAAPMPPARLTEAVERIGPVLSQLYGQTECYPIAVLPRADHQPGGPGPAGACGVPVSTCEVAILTAAGEPITGPGRGEVCVRGPAVMDQYWRRPELSAEALACGWLHTGDIGEFDDRGYLYLVDRAKDLIISGGFNVYPKEVEDALCAHPAVAAAAVFGVPDDRWGEAVVAAVVLKDGRQVSAEQLRHHVRGKKGPVHAPKHIRFLNALPTTALGKTDRPALRAAAQQDT